MLLLNVIDIILFLVNTIDEVVSYMNFCIVFINIFDYFFRYYHGCYIYDWNTWAMLKKPMIILRIM